MLTRTREKSFRYRDYISPTAFKKIFARKGPLLATTRILATTTFFARKFNSFVHRFNARSVRCIARRVQSTTLYRMIHVRYSVHVITQQGRVCNDTYAIANLLNLLHITPSIFDTSYVLGNCASHIQLLVFRCHCLLYHKPSFDNYCKHTSRRIKLYRV